MTTKPVGACSQCGVGIPDGQRCCSMCYGDPEHGRDGLYRQWLAEQEEYEARRREQEEEPQS